MDKVWVSETVTANIQSAHASIQSSKSGLGGVEGARADGETRPRNMKVVYVMRIF